MLLLALLLFISQFCVFAQNLSKQEKWTLYYEVNYTFFENLYFQNVNFHKLFEEVSKKNHHRNTFIC